LTRKRSRTEVSWYVPGLDGVISATMPKVLSGPGAADAGASITAPVSGSNASPITRSPLA